MKKFPLALMFSLSSVLTFSAGFPAGTLVTEITNSLESVQVPIEQVKAGDTVLCFAGEQGPLALGQVLSVNSFEEPCIELWTNSQTVRLKSSFSQLLMLAGTGYITVQNLLQGDKLVQIDLKNDGVLLMSRITRVERGWLSDPPKKVYSLKVSTWHNFFANGLLAHS